MRKILMIILILLFIGNATANSNNCDLYQINATHWSFVTTQTNLLYGSYGYQAFANNISSDYRVLEYSSTSDTSPPNSISDLENTTGNFYHNWTWSNPTDIDFTHTEIYINGIFTVNSSNEYYDLSASPHNTSTISTHTVDTTGNINTTWINHTSTIGNNPVSLSNISTSYNLDIGSNLHIDCNAIDADSDTPTFSTNRTDLFTDFSTNTGIGNYLNASEGVYHVNFGVSDGYGSTDAKTITITVSSGTGQVSTFHTIAEMIQATVPILQKIVDLVINIIPIIFVLAFVVLIINIFSMVLRTIGVGK